LKTDSTICVIASERSLASEAISKKVNSPPSLRELLWQELLDDTYIGKFEFADEYLT